MVYIASHKVEEWCKEDHRLLMTIGPSAFGSILHIHLG